jgi:hypothetical protein
VLVLPRPSPRRQHLEGAEEPVACDGGDGERGRNGGRLMCVRVWIKKVKPHTP